MGVNANYATDRQSYRYENGEEWEFFVRVNFDAIVKDMSRRARLSKRGKATAISGAVQVTAQKIRGADKTVAS